MPLKISLILLAILLIYTRNLIAQEQVKSDIQVMARVISGCIISTSEIYNTPQLYCTHNTLDNNKANIPYRTSNIISTLSTSSSTATLIVTTIEF